MQLEKVHRSRADFLIAVRTEPSACYAATEAEAAEANADGTKSTQLVSSRINAVQKKQRNVGVFAQQAAGRAATGQWIKFLER